MRLDTTIKPNKRSPLVGNSSTVHKGGRVVVHTLQGSAGLLVTFTEIRTLATRHMGDVIKTVASDVCRHVHPNFFFGPVCL